MKKWTTGSLIMLLFFSLMLSSCAAKVHTDPAKIINISVNQEFTIALGSNITTGYSWQPKYDLNELTLVGNEYKENDTTGQVVGAPGTQYFHFKATKSGTTQISFTYYRPWETPKPEDTTAKFNIVIK